MDSQLGEYQADRPPHPITIMLETRVFFTVAGVCLPLGPHGPSIAVL